MHKATFMMDGSPKFKGYASAPAVLFDRKTCNEICNWINSSCNEYNSAEYDENLDSFFIYDTNSIDEDNPKGIIDAAAGLCYTVEPGKSMILYDLGWFYEVEDEPESIKNLSELHGCLDLLAAYIQRATNRSEKDARCIAYEVMDNVDELIANAISGLYLEEDEI